MTGPRICFAIAACSLLGACGESEAGQGPAAMTVGEARSLDQAAEMLEQQRLPRDTPSAPDGVEESFEPGDAAVQAE